MTASKWGGFRYWNGQYIALIN